MVNISRSFLVLFVGLAVVAAGLGSAAAVSRLAMREEIAEWLEVFAWGTLALDFIVLGVGLNSAFRNVSVGDDVRFKLTQAYGVEGAAGAAGAGASLPQGLDFP